MRNKILSAMVAAGMMMYGASAFAVSNPPTAIAGGSGKVNFTAVIQNGACDIKIPEQAVDFGQIAVKNIKSAPSPSISKDFSIQLDDCSLESNGHDPFSKVQVAFTGTHAHSDTTLSGQGDTDVGVQIAKKGSTSYVKFDGSAPTDNFNIFAGTPGPRLDFTAYLVQEDAGASVKAGTFSATATYTLTYN